MDFFYLTSPPLKYIFRGGWLFNFWLGNVLRATTACTFSTSRHPKVLRPWCALYILTWKCASRHNGVHFFPTSQLPKWPETASFLHFLLRNVLCATTACNFSSLIRTRRFSEPTFRPSGVTNHWQNTMFRDFATFSRAWIFFLLTLSLLWSSLFCSSLLWLFPPLLFHLSILSEVWLLNIFSIIFGRDSLVSQQVYYRLYFFTSVWCGGATSLIQSMFRTRRRMDRERSRVFCC